MEDLDKIFEKYKGIDRVEVDSLIYIGNYRITEGCYAYPQKIIDVDENDVFFAILPLHHVYECTGGFSKAGDEGNKAYGLAHGTPHEDLCEGKVIKVVSGGATLPEWVSKGLEDLGFPILNPPHSPRKKSVGLPIPGVEIRLFEVNEIGEGEIAAKGPMVMKGYYKN